MEERKERLRRSSVTFSDQDGAIPGRNPAALARNLVVPEPCWSLVMARCLLRAMMRGTAESETLMLLTMTVAVAQQHWR